jgi:FkbM family methyltransferase
MSMQVSHTRGFQPAGVLYSDGDLLDRDTVVRYIADNDCVGADQNIMLGKASMNSEHVFAQIVLRSWPFGRGVSRIMNTFFPNRTFKEQTQWVKTRDGVNLKVFPNDLLGRHLYLIGEYERSVLDVLYELSQPGDVLLDIGANLGYVSACFLQNVANSKVIAVDPQPGVLAMLEENLAQFPGHSQIFPVAISERKGTARFAINPSNLGNARIVSDGADGIDIQTVTGGQLLGPIDRVDLVKIDVEGHEEQVINSCKDEFARLRPRAILFEEGGAKAAPDGAIGRTLTGLGYEMFGIHKRMLGHSIEKLEHQDGCTCDNYLAVLK